MAEESTSRVTTEGWVVLASTIVITIGGVMATDMIGGMVLAGVAGGIGVAVAAALGLAIGRRQAQQEIVDLMATEARRVMQERETEEAEAAATESVWIQEFAHAIQVQTMEELAEAAQDSDDPEITQVTSAWLLACRDHLEKPKADVRQA